MAPSPRPGCAPAGLRQPRPRVTSGGSGHSAWAAVQVPECSVVVSFDLHLTQRGREGGASLSRLTDEKTKTLKMKSFPVTTWSMICPKVRVIRSGAERELRHSRLGSTEGWDQNRKYLGF